MPQTYSTYFQRSVRMPVNSGIPLVPRSGGALEQDRAIGQRAQQRHAVERERRARARRRRGSWGRGRRSTPARRAACRAAGPGRASAAARGSRARRAGPCPSRRGARRSMNPLSEVKISSVSSSSPVARRASTIRPTPSSTASSEASRCRWASARARIRHGLIGGRRRMSGGLSETSASSNDGERGSGAPRNAPAWRRAGHRRGDDPRIARDRAGARCAARRS